MTLRDKLRILGACGEALDWIGEKDISTAWIECPHPRWRHWILARITSHLSRSVIASWNEAIYAMRERLPKAGAHADNCRDALSIFRIRACGPIAKAATIALACRDALMAADDQETERSIQTNEIIDVVSSDELDAAIDQAILVR